MGTSLRLSYSRPGEVVITMVVLLFRPGGRLLRKSACCSIRVICCVNEGMGRGGARHLLAITQFSVKSLWHLVFIAQEAIVMECRQLLYTAVNRARCQPSLLVETHSSPASAGDRYHEGNSASELRDSCVKAQSSLSVLYLALSPAPSRSRLLLGGCGPTGLPQKGVVHFSASIPPPFTGNCPFTPKSTGSFPGTISLVHLWCPLKHYVGVARYHSGIFSGNTGRKISCTHYSVLKTHTTVVVPPHFLPLGETVTARAVPIFIFPAKPHRVLPYSPPSITVTSRASFV